VSFIYSIILQGHQAASNAVEAGGEAHGESHEGVPHLQNVVTIIAEGVDKLAHNAQASANLINWVNVIYSIAIMLMLLIFFAWAARRLKREPGRWQNAVEMAFGTLDNFVQDVLGPEGRKYVPLIGTLFIYILTMNLFGLVPVLGHSPSSSLNITLSLALFVFITVQIHGIMALGLIGYIRHFADLPEKPHPVQIILSPLMFFLHVIGELAKPVSLSLRLFGNITGEDVLIAVFVLMAAGKLIPLQLFVYPIALLGSFIQALVFALLTTVYILLMSPHKEEQ
jgi:F-type H+-transporting ATPase subunit a